MFATAIEAQNAFDSTLEAVTTMLKPLPRGTGIWELGNAVVFDSPIQEYPGIWRAQVTPEGEIIWESLLELHTLSASLASLENDAADWEAAVQDLTQLMDERRTAQIQFDLDYLFLKMDEFAE